ncbi:hypothetical protein GPECTOR_102g65 [Gonium pectorale]|uniref:Thioesterase domain-containing protein n=1 Tax=Gonium pectorale TaxID=33097 RepID=A0A150FZT5_GONPE|nr:hypothetical protein GPECTOR_102g65 [Gonium pectorale]|eukprot:KXZ43112.1 hypothetical protein GPECTOR_102g65 [Gonium pectorale]
MTSLHEVTSFPPAFPSSGRPPLLADLTLAEVLQAAYEALPSSAPARELLFQVARRLHVVRPPPPLSAVPWLAALERREGNVLVLDRHGLTLRGGLLPDDHLFKSMARSQLIKDNHVVWAPSWAPLPPPVPHGKAAAASTAASAASSAASASASATAGAAPPAASPDTRGAATVFNAYALSGAVCGHPGIVHGGLSSAIVDETFGYLLYLLAGASVPSAGCPRPTPVQPAAPAAAAAAVPPEPHSQQAGEPDQQDSCSGGCAGGGWRGPDLRAAMTAHLEVDFLRPLPADTVVACVAQVDRVEGRKVWLRAQLLGPGDGLLHCDGGGSTGGVGAAQRELFAEGKALFITPR